MSIESDFELSLLYEWYSSLLTQKQRNVINMHINMDYSLAEIAQIEGGTRQAALDAIKRAENRLRQFESILKLQKRYSCTIEALDEIENAGDEIQRQCAIDKIKHVWEEN